MCTERTLPVLSAEAVDQPVAPEEDAAAGEDAEQDGAVTRRFPYRLTDEVERDGADQHARPEAHDEADRPEADPEPERRSCADHERRRRERAPAEGASHLLRSWLPHRPEPGQDSSRKR
jgi:hypothetical protein